MRAICHLLYLGTRDKIGVRAEHEQFVGVDIDVELRAERDLMHALQLRDEIDAAVTCMQVKVRFRAAQFGEFEQTGHGNRMRVARRKTQMAGPDADPAGARSDSR